MTSILTKKKGRQWQGDPQRHPPRGNRRIAPSPWGTAGHGPQAAAAAWRPSSPGTPLEARAPAPGPFF